MKFNIHEEGTWHLHLINVHGAEPKAQSLAMEGEINMCDLRKISQVGMLMLI